MKDSEKNLRLQNLAQVFIHVLYECPVVFLLRLYFHMSSLQSMIHDMQYRFVMGLFLCRRILCQFQQQYTTYSPPPPPPIKQSDKNYRFTKQRKGAEFADL